MRLGKPLLNISSHLYRRYKLLQLCLKNDLELRVPISTESVTIPSMHLHKTCAQCHVMRSGPLQIVLLAMVLLSALIKPTTAADPATCPGCPCFTAAVYEETISETVPVGTIALTVTATDDPADVLIYSLLGTADFMIDSITGDITVHNQLDFETTGSYTFLAQVSDSTHIVTATIILNVIDENESVFQCNQSLFYVSIMEGLPMNHSFSLHCMDTNDPMSTQLHYEITAGNENAAFEIDSFGNVLVVGSLDYESESRHELIITVSIDGMPPPQVISTIEVFVLVEPSNEFYPVFSVDIYEFDISESTHIGAFIGQVSAADMDSGDDGIIAFMIESGVTDDSQHFSISPATGDIFLNQLLDFESTVAMSHQLEFIILASDSSPSESQRLASSASVVVHILDSNDHAPTFSQALYYAQVAENMEAGMEILQVVCDDEDSGSNQEITYSILSGNEGGEFAILATGQIVLASSLDYDDGIQLYRLTAECRDNGSPVLSSEVAIVIEITSVNEFYPQPEVTSVTVSEDVLPGTVIAEIVAQDLDRGAAGILFFSLVFNSYCPEELLYIDPRTGMVYLTGSLDYERGVQNISCIVMVKDSQQPSRTRESSLSITVIDVNDEPPSCNPPVHVISIAEDSPIGFEILTFSCMDPDSPSLQYSISGANDSVLPFQLASLGTQAKLTLLAGLDADSQPLVYTVPIHVSDGSITVEITVKIFVSNVNEFAPIFVTNSFFECEVSESVNIGAIVCETGAIDHDSGLDGFLQYQIVNSTDSQIFAINPRTAQVILTGVVDYEKREYFLVIKACDSAVSPLCTLADARVTVVDESVQPEDSSVPPLQELIEVEGMQNSVILRVQNLSLKLWFEGAKENFKAAMARSVTQFCALFPETCSLVSGCAGFYSSRKKRSTESYSNFTNTNIVVLPGYPVEAVMNDITLLEVNFYVSLPDDASKAPLRDTNYVIPRSTLNEIVQLDSRIIEAVVRDSVSASFTQGNSGSSVQSSERRWREATIAISVIAAVILSVIVMVMIVIAVYKSKRRFHTTKVIPISCSIKKPTPSEQSSAPCSSNSNSRNRKQQNSNSKRASETSTLSTQTPSDQCSLISLGDNEHTSMENNPSRGSISQKEILKDLESSIKLHGEGEGLPAGNQDCLQNWQYSPPRAFGSTLRPGHARISAWTTGRHLK